MVSFRHCVLLVEGTGARPGQKRPETPTVIRLAGNWAFPGDRLADLPGVSGCFRRSRRVTAGALDKGQVRPVSDLPDLLQDCPLFVGHGNAAVVDSLGELNERGVLRRCGRLSGRLRTDQPPW